MKGFPKYLILLLLLLSATSLMAQYAPAAGQPGSTAIAKDSSVITGWATQVNVQRGWLNISDKSQGKVSYGNPNAALGKADIDVVSLGDSGVATLQFARTIYNGPGPDFAVFENAFDDLFLELAFVEVSSDGVNFFRFPAHSLTQTQTQVGGFGQLNCEKIHNLAGKYRGGFGTPFDLEELKNEPGLDVMHITHIRLIDVVGSIDSLYGTRDSAGNMINDPYPTPFNSGGFDLDAVGVMHLSSGVEDVADDFEISVYPNPVSDFMRLQTNEDLRIKIFNLQGQLLYEKNVQSGTNSLNLQFLVAGTYLIYLSANEKSTVRKFIKI